MQRSSALSLQNRMFFSLLFAMLVSFTGASCSSQEAEVRKGIEAYAKPLGAREVILDSFFISPDFPDKAYAGTTITFDSASARGGYLTQKTGFILRRDDKGWVLVKTTEYTTEEVRARDLLAGLK